MLRVALGSGLVCAVFLGAAGCTLDRSGLGPAADAGMHLIDRDGSSEGTPDAPADALDGAATLGDGGPDAHVDAGLFDGGASFDAGRDAATDAASVDTGMGVDAGMDAYDAGFDASRDAGFDASRDAGADAGTDSGDDGGCRRCCVAGEEVCDGLDNDCDLAVDEDDVCGSCVVYRNAARLNVYWICADERSADSAASRCEGLGSLAHLVQISDAVENDRVTAYAEEVNTATGESHDYWTGLTDADDEGIWRWADGSIATYTKWRMGGPSPDEPNGGHAANCMTLLRFADDPDFGSDRTTWNDDVCSRPNAYICESDFELIPIPD